MVAGKERKPGFRLIGTASRRFHQRVLRRSGVFQDRIQMFEGFIHCQGVHLTAVLVGPVLDRRFKEMSRDLNGQRIGYDSPGALLVLHPCWMRQRYPHGTAAGKKFHIHRIGMSSGNRHNQRLINTVKPFSRPAVNCVKVLVHT